MSCRPCGIAPSGSFAAEDKTWSKSSSLEPSRWGPFPSLENPKNCYGSNSKEGYDNVNSGAIYQTNQRVISQGHYPPTNRSAVAVEKYNYDSYDKMPRNYDQLDKSWVSQSAYSLENYVQYSSPFNRSGAYVDLDSTWMSQKPYQL